MVAEIGFKAQLKCDDAGTGQVASGAQTAWVGGTVITLPERDRTVHEYHEHSQTSEANQVCAGVIKNGRLKLNLYYSPANYKRANTLFENKAPKIWKVEQPDADGAGAGTPQIFTLTGFVSKVGDTAFELDGLTMFAVEIAWGGTMTITDPTP